MSRFFFPFIGAIKNTTNDITGDTAKDRKRKNFAAATVFPFTVPYCDWTEKNMKQFVQNGRVNEFLSCNVKVTTLWVFRGK